MVGKLEEIKGADVETGDTARPETRREDKEEVSGVVDVEDTSATCETVGVPTSIEGWGLAGLVIGRPSSDEAVGVDTGT